MGVLVFMTSPHFYVFPERKPPKYFSRATRVQERARPGAGTARTARPRFAW